MQKWNILISIGLCVVSSAFAVSVGFYDFEGASPLSSWANNPNAGGYSGSVPVAVADNGPSNAGSQAVEMNGGSMWKSGIATGARPFVVNIDHKIVGALRPSGATGFYYDVQYFGASGYISMDANTFVSVSAANSWFVHRAEFVPPAGTETVTLVIRAHFVQTTEAGVLRVDNVKIIDKSTPSFILNRFFEGANPLVNWTTNPMGGTIAPISDNGPSAAGAQSIEMTNGSMWISNVPTGENRFYVEIDHKIVGTLRSGGATGFYYDVQYFDASENHLGNDANNFVSVGAANTWYGHKQLFTPLPNTATITLVIRAHYVQTTEAGALRVDNVKVRVPQGGIPGWQLSAAFEGGDPMAGWANNPNAGNVQGSAPVAVADNGLSEPGIQAIEMNAGSMWKGNIAVGTRKFSVIIDHKVVGTLRTQGQTGFYYDIQYWAGTTHLGNDAYNFVAVSETNVWYAHCKEFTPRPGTQTITLVIRAHYVQTTEAGQLRIDNIQVVDYTPIPYDGDLNNDGKVAVGDLQVMANEWLQGSTVIPGSETLIENGDFENYLNNAALQTKWYEFGTKQGNTYSTMTLLTNPADAYEGDQAMRWQWSTVDTSGENDYWTEMLYAFDIPVDLSQYDEIHIRIKRHAGNHQAELLFARLIDDVIATYGYAANSYLWKSEGSTFANPDEWVTWVIDLNNMDEWFTYNGYYSKADITGLVALQLGVSEHTSSSTGGSGVIDIDYITFVKNPRCSGAILVSDINGDCITNLLDFAILGEEWLKDQFIY